MATLLERVNVVQSVLDDKHLTPLTFGANDCVTLVYEVLKRLGRTDLPLVPEYNSLAGAKRALKSLGHDSVEGLFSAYLVPIAPASMLVGDVGVIRSDSALKASVVKIGVHFMGFPAEDPRLHTITLTEPFSHAFSIRGQL